MRRHLLFSTVLLLVSLTPLHATTVRRLSFDELVARAQSIVQGRVVDLRTYWTADQKLILTDYTIQVQETMKGSTPQTVTVTTIGGKIGNTILHVSGMPAFEQGENAILFLEKSNTSTTVVGLNQGKFTVSNGEISNTVSGLSFPDGTAGKPVKMPLDEFKRQVRLRINK
ncbi:MAG TPA: hypothetical protein VE422_25055 [Terriglobia bacterium]|nr:hypothetical protein [Terriglobia bacterium]